MSGDEAVKKNRILVLIDLPNLLINMDCGLDPLRFKAELGFERILEQLEAIGQIETVFVFASTKTPGMYLYQHFFYDKGFLVITCPHLEKDTTDDTLIKLAEKMVDNYTCITHLCLVSGDHHFGITLKKAKEKQIKIIIISPIIDSLSDELIPLADADEQGKKMIYLFSPLTEK